MDEKAAATYAPLQPFSRLIGSWDLRHRDLNTKAEWGGNDTFEWLPGGRFLAFHHHEDGNDSTGGIDGVMIIGNEMGWEEGGWIAAHNGREALGRALTGMVRDGAITKKRAVELARMVLRENARALYGF